MYLTPRSETSNPFSFPLLFSLVSSLTSIFSSSRERTPAALKCAQSSPTEGTTGFFLDEVADGKRLTLATLSSSAIRYSNNTTPPLSKINGQSDATEYQTDCIERMADRTDNEGVRTR